MSSYAVTVVMPALNEANNLVDAARNVLESFACFGISGQLYVINDGSSDKTGELADQLALRHGNVRVIHHSLPQGIGGSFWEGVQRADGEFVVMLPGDGENDAAEILRYLPLLEQVDIVVPFVFNRSVRSPGRRLISIIYREIIKATFGLSLNYMNGTVMYRRTIFEGIELQNSGFFYQSELLIKCIRRGYLYAEVPYAIRQRIGGDSKATRFCSLLKIVSGYLGLVKEVISERSVPPVVSGSATARRLMRLDDETA
jgi:glycosyltransferase involved in cell wall biosynthesis